MKLVAALMLSALTSFASGCAHQGISLASDDSQGELLALHESDSEVVKPEYIRDAHQSTRVATSR